MRLIQINIENYRSIKAMRNVSIAALQALVGENDAGKSNILRAIKCFLTSGAGGMEPSDFNDSGVPAIIECEFGGLSAEERRKLRRYLLGDKIVLRKQLSISFDEAKAKTSVKPEYHGYQAEPKDEHLSIAKIEAAYGARPKWKEIAEKAGILDLVQDDQGKVTKASYRAGIDSYLSENDVEYELATLGDTQALGIPQNLLSALPEFYLLPAITDYSDEVDRRSSSTVFRRLMADLADRVMRADGRYQELESAISKVRDLLNTNTTVGAEPRLDALGQVERSLRDVVKKLMPSVQAVSLGVEIEPCREMFSKGVSIKIDDGVLTDVLDKGHGMQRSLVFSLLQMLIASSREGGGGRPIILGIEEPELYIHPHCQRLIYRVLKDFSGMKEDGGAEATGQVIYTTHSPAFVDVWRYECIGVVRKPDLATGTIVRQAAAGVLGSPEDRKVFKMLTCFGLKHNEVFFGRHTVLVEGPEDEIGVIATARKLGRIEELPEEMGLTILVGSKGEIPKYQKVLNALGIEYGVLLEMDGKPENDAQNAPILANLAANRIAKVPNRIEDMLGLGRHFDDQVHAKNYFSDSANINAAFEEVVKTLLPPAGP
jgi:putative ATP-dependent endonuclease of the OLD family